MNPAHAAAMIPKETPPKRRRPAANLDALLCLVLALGTLAVYWPGRYFEFVSYNDEDAIVKNAVIRGGLTLSSAMWAFQNLHQGSWQPLTVLSFMLACQQFGLNAGAHHLVGISFHCAN